MAEHADLIVVNARVLTVDDDNPRAEAVAVKGGRIVEENFDSYDSMRIAQMPKVESIIMPSGGSDPWGGVGEPTICVAAPAVLNAYFKATGKRMRSVPLKNNKITMV